MALYGGFFVFIERFYSYAERMYYYYHYYYYMSALAITKSMIIIIIKNSTKLLRFYEVPKHEMQKCFAEYYEEWQIFYQNKHNVLFASVNLI